MLSLALKPRWIAGLLLALALATLFVSLSAWQVDRAQHRNETIAETDLDTVREFDELLVPQEPMSGLIADQRTRLSGRYLPDQQIVVPGRVLDGEEGYWVVTMFAPDGAALPDASEIAGGFTVAEDQVIAVPVVRGWTADAETAHASRAAEGEAEIIGRLGPTEAPVPSRGLGEGEALTVSTAQLVNEFGVYSYSAIVFPEQETGQGASYAAGGLRGFEPPETRDEGGFNWQSAVYAVEWLVFAAFALHIWWRLLRDEAQRQQEAAGAAGRDIAEYTVVKEAGEKIIHD